MNVGEQNGAKSSFLSTGEISETQIREKSSLRVIKPILAESYTLEIVEETRREKHITPLLLRHFLERCIIQTERGFGKTSAEHVLSQQLW